MQQPHSISGSIEHAGQTVNASLASLKALSSPLATAASSLRKASTCKRKPALATVNVQLPYGGVSFSRIPFLGCLRWRPDRTKPLFAFRDFETNPRAHLPRLGSKTTNQSKQSKQRKIAQATWSLSKSHFGSASFSCSQYAMASA